MSRLSIIVPAYDVENQLEKCLKSILFQSYRDFEIIVVDDGSKDRSGIIAEEMSRQYSEIRVIHKENAGLPQARKTGVENATGEYIGFVDGDDYIEPDMYAVLMDLIQRTNADIACSAFYNDYPHRKSCKQSFITRDETLFTAKKAIAEIHRGKNISSYLWNKVYRRHLFEGVDYPFGNPVGEDYFILMQLLQNTSFIIQTNRGLYHYVQKWGSMSHSGYNPERKKSLSYFGRYRESLLQQYPEMKKDIIPYHLREELAVIVAMGRGDHKDTELARMLQHDMRKNLFFLIKSKLGVEFKIAGIATAISWKILLIYGRFIGATIIRNGH